MPRFLHVAMAPRSRGSARLSCAQSARVSARCGESPWRRPCLDAARTYYRCDGAARLGVALETAARPDALDDVSRARLDEVARVVAGRGQLSTPTADGGELSRQRCGSSPERPA